MRLFVAAAMLLCGAAPVPEPVCGDPGILREVTETLAGSFGPIVLDAPPVGELSVGALGSPPLAHCAVRGHTTGYDTNRYGMTPVYEPYIVNYTIELRRNGMFVSLDAAPTRVHAAGNPSGGGDFGFVGVPGGAGRAAPIGRRP